MQATDILRNEHRVIDQMLQCLEKIADRCCQLKWLDHLTASQALDFFRTFADRCHHEKEEQHLFPLLEARGFSRLQGPTGVMHHEHEEGRRHLCAMAGALSRAADGDPDAVQQFVAHARAYVALLREHIRKEDNCLFPLAEQALSQEDQQALQASFAGVEDARAHGAVHEKYLQLANELADRLQVPRAPFAVTVQVGCCHH
jgi:hemerythrin-like domain-containing protein